MSASCTPPPGPRPHTQGEYDGAEGGAGGGGLVDLPPAEMGRLEEIAAALAAVPPMQRERAAQQIMAPGYLRALLELFKAR